MAVGWNLTKMPDNQNEIFCSISSGSNFDFKKLMEQRIKALVLPCLYYGYSDQFVHFFFKGMDNSRAYILNIHRMW